jgi:hypothetical protein
MVHPISRVKHIKIIIFWDVILHRWLIGTNFSKQPAAAVYRVPSPTLRMKAAGFPKIFTPIYQTMWVVQG